MGIQSVLLAVLLVPISVASASEKVPKLESITDGAHREVSLGFIDFVEDIDQFFGGAPRDGIVNKSWARMRLDSTNRQGQSNRTKASVKFKLVLPETKKRFHLLLSSEDRDNQVQTIPPITSTSVTSDSGNFTTGLRFLHKLRKDIDVKFDLGVRVMDGKTQLLTRLGSHYSRAIGKIWKTRLNSNLLHYSRSGLQNTLSLDFERYLGTSNKALAMVTTQVHWQDGTDGASVTEQLGWYGNINDSMSLAFILRLDFVTASENDGNLFRNGELNFRLRKNLGKPWLSLDVEPNVSWPAEENYAAVYGGLVRIEVLFQ